MPSAREIPNKDWGELCRDLLAGGLAVKFRVKGLSMEPVLYEGDLVEASPVIFQQIRVGDLILYRTAELKPIVHRVRRLETRRSVIAEAASGGTERVMGEMILGRVKLLGKNRWRRLRAAVRRVLAR